MSDDQHRDHDAIEALLRASQEETSQPATEAELDVEFGAIMLFLDNIDEEQAIELTDVAARARNDLDSPSEEQHLPDRQTHKQLENPQIELKQVILPRNDRRIPFGTVVANTQNEVKQLAETTEEVRDTQVLAARINERRPRRTTIKLMRLTKLGIASTTLAALLTIALSLASVVTPSEVTPPPGSQSGTGNINCDSDYSCDININMLQAQEIAQEAAGAAGDDDTELRRHLRAAPGATEPPNGPDPYPFIVVDTGNLGLFARATNTINSAHAGITLNRTIVWANCVAQSDFTPPDAVGNNNVGSQWVQVRWRHLDDSHTSGLSEPHETATAWMYRGYLEPVGHNGDIPHC